MKMTLGSEETAAGAGKASLRSEALDWSLLVAAFAAVAASYAFYLARADGLMHADTATEILAGREMVRQKTILLRDFYHSTEIFLLRTPVFVALWTFVSDGMLGAFRLAVATEIAIESACLLYMMRRLGAGIKSAAFALLAFFGSQGYDGSGFGGLGGDFYGTLFSTAFLVTGYYAATLQGKLNGTDAAVSVALLLLAFVFGVSSPRLLTTVLVPLLLVQLGMRLWTGNWVGGTADRALRAILLWTAFSAAGWYLTLKFIIPVGFGPPESALRGASGLAYIAFETFPALVQKLVDSSPVAQVAGSFEAISVAGATGLMCLFFYVFCALGHRPTEGQPAGARGAVLRFLLLSIFLTILAILLTFHRLVVNSRYLFMAYVLLPVGAGLLHGDLARGRPFLARSFLAFSCAFFIVNSLQNVRDLPAHAERNPSGIVVRHASEIADTLVRRGVARAYSLYWDSAVVTVLTDGRVDVYGVLGDMSPSRTMFPLSAYSADSAGERSAFLRVHRDIEPWLRQSPVYSLTSTGLLDEATETAIIRDPEADIEIYFFADNPFTDPPGYRPGGIPKSGAVTGVESGSPGASLRPRPRAGTEEPSGSLLPLGHTRK